ncbi:hypothetical protein BXZ70DRAFT_303137 [Cristinia sonorae]|uniref:F-box domain-containing protein n=1 Tax=Cristinia sonorae TaxID=1940300 RepID=A0A8K0XNJ3_9AGAR|nr:hypothetical protein BXZ70DRAFT_303137 [Cristinia sonorae]
MQSNVIAPWAAEAAGNTVAESQQSALLPWDVVLHIMAFVSSQSDLSRMTRTCATLHKHGTLILSRQCYISILSPWKTLFSFCDFMEKSPDRRLALRSLTLSYLAPSSSEDRINLEKTALMKLAKVISDARYLESLQISDLEELLAASPAMLSAISSIQSLRTVEFNYLNSLSCALLASMQTSRLETVILDFSLDLDETHPDELSLPDVLRNFQSSLVELFVEDLPENTSFHYDAIVFPRLRSLSIRTDYLDASLEDLHASFPNLRHLVLQGIESPDMSELPNESDLSNWDLETLHCSVPWAYALGFDAHSHIWRGVHLGDERWHSNVDYFRIVLERIEPKHLDIDLHMFDLCHTHHESFAEIFPECGVTHLKLDFTKFNDHITDTQGQSARWLSSLFSDLKTSLKKMPLEFLSFRFQADEQPVSRPADALVWYETSTGLYLRHDFNSEQYSLQLAKSIPSLKHVHFHFRRTQQPDGVWVVGRSGKEGEKRDSVAVVRLAEEDGMKVLKESPFAEQLCLTPGGQFLEYALPGGKQF